MSMVIGGWLVQVPGIKEQNNSPVTWKVPQKHSHIASKFVAPRTEE